MILYDDSRLSSFLSIASKTSSAVIILVVLAGYIRLSASFSNKTSPVFLSSKIAVSLSGSIGLPLSSTLGFAVALGAADASALSPLSAAGDDDGDADADGELVGLGLSDSEPLSSPSAEDVAAGSSVDPGSAYAAVKPAVNDNKITALKNKLKILLFILFPSCFYKKYLFTTYYDSV